VYDEEAVKCAYDFLTDHGAKNSVMIDIPGDIDRLIEGVHATVIEGQALDERLRERYFGHEASAKFSCLRPNDPAWAIAHKLGGATNLVAAAAALGDDGEGPSEERPSSATRREQYRKERVVCLSEDELASKAGPGPWSEEALRSIEASDPTWLMDRSASLPAWWLDDTATSPWRRVMRYHKLLVFKPWRGAFRCGLEHGRSVYWSPRTGFEIRLPRAH
jgi:hypothetical protein